MTKFLGILLLLVSSFSNSYSQKEGAMLYGEKQVVFPAEKKVSIGILKDTVYKRFTPSMTDVNETDSLLKQYFQGLTTENAIHTPGFYYKQYAGVWPQGKLYIFVSGYCRKPEGYLENMNLVKGGGNCYFQALIDMVTKKVVDLLFNAPK